MTDEFHAGVKAGVSLILPTLAGGISFGVLAEPVLGAAASIVMSITVFSGAAQFAALTVLATGGGALAAIIAGMLLNARWLPMGLALGPSLRGSRARRAVESVALVDASFVVASNGDGTFSRDRLIGSTLPQFAAWNLGTVIGVLGGSFLGDPEALGLDAMFPAFFACLLFDLLKDRTSVVTAALGALIAFVLMPFTPAGVPVVAAACAALIGLRARA
ncbi:AzlC family ABC transporter permease [Solirubrobacter phytolaccae]|uniref:AzlC family ABC transporter permease n=1 Tax=Solirubrobacter phytolaccae TaxID=1404360 RepID=A0A9X3NBB2_9ACTN|nr:AzlC family ABC transporter permease [Solirubrobacter phytolaccae]MDA0179547.1 AzlC family ABC transporter permease [Solirubrobacter phytolaccae]